MKGKRCFRVAVSPYSGCRYSTPSGRTRLFLAVDRRGGADRSDFDTNGNITVRSKGPAGRHTLVWDDANPLP